MTKEAYQDKQKVFAALVEREDITNLLASHAIVQKRTSDYVTFAFHGFCQ